MVPKASCSFDLHKKDTKTYFFLAYSQKKLYLCLRYNYCITFNKLPNYATAK